MPHHRERIPGDREAWHTQQGCHPYLLMFRTDRRRGMGAGDNLGISRERLFYLPDGLFQQVSVLPARGPGSRMRWGWVPAPAFLLVRPAMGM